MVETGGIPLFWEKNATGKYVVFTYEKDAPVPPVNPLTAAKAAAEGVDELAGKEALLIAASIAVLISARVAAAGA